MGLFEGLLLLVNAPLAGTAVYPEVTFAKHTNP